MGFSTVFVFMGSGTQALGALAEAARPSGAVGSNDPAVGRGLPKLLPRPLPWKVSARAATPLWFA